MSKSPITKEQWLQIEAELKNLYCRVVFDYQGQELSVQRMRTGEGRMDLVVLLDGIIGTGEDDLTPEIQAVWRKRSRSLYSPSEKKKIIKKVGKRAAKKHFPWLDEKLEHWEPIFTSAAVLVRQYKKVADLTLKSIGHSTVEAAEPAA